MKEAPGGELLIMSLNFRNLWNRIIRWRERKRESACARLYTVSFLCKMFSHSEGCILFCFCDENFMEEKK